MFQEGSQISDLYVGQPHEDRGVAPVVVRGEEGHRIGLHSEITFVETTFDHERVLVIPQPREELAAYPKPRGSVARGFFDARKSEEKSTGGLGRYYASFRHGQRVRGITRAA